MALPVAFPVAVVAPSKSGFAALPVMAASFLKLASESWRALLPVAFPVAVATFPKSASESWLAALPVAFPVAVATLSKMISSESGSSCPFSCLSPS